MCTSAKPTQLATHEQPASLTQLSTTQTSNNPHPGLPAAHVPTGQCRPLLLQCGAVRCSAVLWVMHESEEMCCCKHAPTAGVCRCCCAVLLHAMQGEGGSSGGTAPRPAMQQHTVQQQGPLPFAGLQTCNVLLPQLHTVPPHTRWSLTVAAPASGVAVELSVAFSCRPLAQPQAAKQGGAPTVTAHTAVHRLLQWACATTSAIHDAQVLGTHRGHQSCRITLHANRKRTVREAAKLRGPWPAHKPRADAQNTLTTNKRQ